MLNRISFERRLLVHECEKSGFFCLTPIIVSHVKFTAITTIIIIMTMEKQQVAIRTGLLLLALARSFGVNITSARATELRLHNDNYNDGQGGSGTGCSTYLPTPPLSWMVDCSHSYAIFATILLRFSEALATECQHDQSGRVNSPRFHCDFQSSNHSCYEVSRL